MKYQWWRVREKGGKDKFEQIKKKEEERLMEDERKDIKQKNRQEKKK